MYDAVQLFARALHELDQSQVVCQSAKERVFLIMKIDNTIYRVRLGSGHIFRWFSQGHSAAPVKKPGSMAIHW